ncbi:MAG: trypsin-like peptidase domain-containing protein [Methylacidiphilales bacterium]|nr:trypsin-like peptidase domain-containing protein [Candidatus Methylacidiphilales bacterium]
MKRLLLFTAVFALALSGCNKADPPSDDSRPSAPPAPKMPVDFTPETRGKLSTDDVPLLEQIDRENERVVASALPSMVRITATQPTDPKMKFFGKDFPFKLPFNNPHEIPTEEPAFGSGVIISKDGYIVTNYHVIEDAKDVQVQLQDRRSFLARIVAYDAVVDVAVLKIDARDLKPMPWGDSDKVQVGQQVFAIGDPFNLDDSVSKGIVSATSRDLPDSGGYDDYIQTDAAINPGNSGGALINVRGELIGINAAIASVSRVNMGVGFAIPSNLVRYAVGGLLKEGKLVRGYLGVRLPETIDEGVIAQLGFHTDEGALLAGVQSHSPADEGGLRAGDFITDVDGHKIGSAGDLRLVVAQIPVGKDVKVDYIRGGSNQSTTVKIVEAPTDSPVEGMPDDGQDDPAPPAGSSPGVQGNVLDGLQVTDLNDRARGRFNIDGSVTTGVVVAGVKEGSAAAAKGISPGDVIESVGITRGQTQEVPAPGDFSGLATNLKPDQSAVLLVHHGKSSSFIFLTPNK